MLQSHPSQSAAKEELRFSEDAGTKIYGAGIGKVELQEGDLKGTPTL